MVICDTNIISKLLFRDPEVMKQINIIGLKNVYITPIVYIEIVHWLSAFRKFTREDRKEIKAFMDSLKVLHINKSISELSIDIIKKYYNLPVYTHNLKHFKLIKGITLYKEQ